MLPAVVGNNNKKIKRILPAVVRVGEDGNKVLGSGASCADSKQGVGSNNAMPPHGHVPSGRRTFPRTGPDRLHMRITCTGLRFACLLARLARSCLLPTCAHHHHLAATTVLGIVPCPLCFAYVHTVPSLHCTHTCMQVYM